MILTDEQIQKFKEAARPLVNFLCEHAHPHVTVMVDQAGAEILEGLASVNIEDFLKTE